jgi:hypothetical protein
MLKTAKVYYVDVSRTAINSKPKQKPHHVFDGQRVFKVRGLRRLKKADEIYIDTFSRSLR